MRMRQTTVKAYLCRALPVATLLLLPLATGCGVSVVGRWKMVKAIPNRDVFAIENAEFGRDGTFTAAVTIEGKTMSEVGKYEFNGFRLTMRPKAGGQHRYNATVRMGTLEVLDGERKCILKKVGKSKTSTDEQASQPK